MSAARGHGPGAEALLGARLARRSLLAAAGLSVAGCTAIPERGPVVQVSPSVQTPLQQGVLVHPVAPVDGAAPEVVVAGFIDAMASLEPDFPVARQYLTARAAQHWNPAAGVSVFDGDSRTSLGSGQGAVLSARLVGRLDAAGHFSAAAGTTLTHDFGMRRVDGQWRIDNPPVGLLVSLFTLQHRFTPTQVWFLAPDARSVVPERVWLASSPVNPTQAVQALLRGPSDWLSPVVGSALPTSLRLDSPSVSVEGTTARITLGDQLVALPDAQRSLAAAQIGWTLRAFDQVGSFAVQSAGRPWLVPGSTTTGQVALDSLLGMSPVPLVATAPPLAVVQGALGNLDDDGHFIALDGPLGRRWPQDPVAVAQGPSGQIALLGTGGETLHTATGQGDAPVLRLRQKGLVHPQVGASGTLWCAVAGDATRALRRAVGEGAPRVVTVPELRGTRLVTFSLSPDETMLAVVLQRSGSWELGLLRVRGEKVDGYRPVPLAISGEVIDHLLDVGWAGPDELLVLGGNRATGHDSVYLVSADGAQLVELGPTGGEELVGLAVQPQITGTRALLRTRQGTLLRYEAPWRWSELTGDVSAVCYPG